MDDGGDKSIVSVCKESRAALNEPQFLLEHQGKLYLTLAVLEYDPNHPGITDQQKKDIAELRSMIRDQKLPGLETPCEIRMRTLAHTKPPPNRN